MIVLRALGALLTYPRGEMVDALPEIERAVASSASLGARQKERISRLVAWMRSTDPFELEELYVDVFDSGRSTSLHLFEHVHGDSRERGQAMVDLKALYERAGLLLSPSELPDYLPAVLEYLSCRTLDESRTVLRDCAHILKAVGERLAAQGSQYAAVLDALLAVADVPGLDWPVGPVQEKLKAHVDEDWMDAPAFGTETQPVRADAPGVAPLRYMPRASRKAGG